MRENVQSLWEFIEGLGDLNLEGKKLIIAKEVS